MTSGDGKPCPACNSQDVDVVPFGEPCQIALVCNDCGWTA